MAENQTCSLLAVGISDSSVETAAAPEMTLPVIEQWGLRSRRPPKALPPLKSDTLSGMYFEVYRVPETHLTSILRSGGGWCWRLCAADGCVEVTSGSYPTEAACVQSILLPTPSIRSAAI